MDLFNLSLGLLLASALVIALCLGVLAYYFANRRRIISGELYATGENPPPPVPYESIEKAKSALIKENLKQLVGFGIYFLIVIIALNKIFGRIQYGPNLPYLVALTAVGLPFLACFCLIMTRIDKQRPRLLATGISEKETSRLVVRSIIYLPFTLVIIIKLGIRLSDMINK